MSRSKFVKVFIIGLGLTVMLSTAVFAEEKAVPPDSPVSSAVSGTARTDPGEIPAASGIARTGSGTAPAAIVSKPSIEPGTAGDAMYQKQSEIDKYLFDVHKNEIAARGITVTHTVVNGDFVEIGILPFDKENEEFLYQALGRDQVKVVEGEQAIAYSAGPAEGSEGLMYATGAPVGETVTTIPAADAQVVSSPADAQVVLAPAGEQAAAPADAHIYTATAVKAAGQNGKPVSTAMVSAVAAALLAFLGGILYKARRVGTAK